MNTIQSLNGLNDSPSVLKSQNKLEIELKWLLRFKAELDKEWKEWIVFKNDLERLRWINDRNRSVCKMIIDLKCQKIGLSIN